MRRLLFSFCAFAFATGCNTTTTPSGNANLSGAHDLVLVDQLGEGTLAGRAESDGAVVTTGLPAAYFFVTSTAGNELRAFQNVRPGSSLRGVVRAPNPFEPLSIPVLERPTRIIADEGRNAANLRVTGPYVYATRPGAEELSVVSVRRLRQLGGHPIATPAPVSDFTAWMDVQGADVLATPLPATTRLYVATWDGAVGAVYIADLPTDGRDLESLPWRRVLALNGEAIVALTVAPPLANRTLDGAPFCNTKGCLVYAVRRDGGRAGETKMIDVDTGASASLDFGAPVRQLTTSEALPRVYGVLDEEACGSPACGGVLGVDVASATNGVFPRGRDALGNPMQPVRVEGLISGVSVSANANIRVRAEITGSDGQPAAADTKQFFTEVGAVSSTAGTVTFFSGLSGSVIDFNGLRSTVSGASLRTPGALADGGLGFTGEDGGVLGATEAANVKVSGAPEQPWRTVSVETTQGSWALDLTDGYLESQALVAVYKGQVPGLVQVATRLEDLLVLNAGGFEGRALVGDIVEFETGTEATGFQVCGRTTVASIGAGTLTVADVPADCAARVRYSVRAAGAKPVVLVGELEGYLGRAGPGETLTYSRPYVLIPADLSVSRSALTLTVPAALPDVEGAVTSFQLAGNIDPYRVSIDPGSLNNNCFSGSPNQVVFGPVVVSEVPAGTSESTAVTFATTVFVSTPSGNGVAELRPSVSTRLGRLTAADGAACWR